MKSDLTDFHKLRKYLLREITDESELESIETRMLSDELFLAEIDRVEVELIEEYADGSMDTEEKARFEKYFLAAPQRRAKFRFMLALRERVAEYAAGKEAVKVDTPSLSQKKTRGVFVSDLFSSGVFRLGFTALLLLLMAGGFFWFFRADHKVSDGLTALKAAYRDQRPTEARLSELDYAPLINSRGGEAAPVDATQRDKAGLLLISASQEHPSADTYRALGLYYASLRSFDQALEQFDKGSAFAPADARFYADHGAVLLETAKSRPDESAEKNLRNLEKALAQLDAALKIDRGFPPALFNRALCLQEMRSAAAAREAWQKYLELDPSSKWANDARDHLKLLDEGDTGAKTPAQVLNDFMLAYDRGDPQKAWEIAGESKEMITGTMISEQLTRGLLSADAQEAPNADRMLSALIFLGKIEIENTGDNFFSDLAEYYRKAGPDERAKLVLAQDLTMRGYDLCRAAKCLEALPKFLESRKLFVAAGDSLEAAKTDYWISYCKAEANHNESLAISRSLEDYSRKNKYKWLEGQALTQSGSAYILQSKFSQAIQSDQAALGIAREISDSYARQKAFAQLADVYTQLNDPAGALENSQNSLRETGVYFNSPRQAWRNYMFASLVSRRFGLGESAVAYGLEGVRLSRDSMRDQGALVSSYILLSAAYKTTMDYPESLKTAEESVRIGSGFDEGPTKTHLLADSFLQKGDAQRALRDCPGALESYSRSGDLYLEQNAGETLRYYYTAEGKLLCYKELGEEQKIDEELSPTLALAEKLRAEIEQEDVKTSFFSDEQSIYEFAAEHALKKNDNDQAFNYIENGKARSLLDDLRRPGSAAPGPITALPLSDISRQIPPGSQLVQYAVLPDKLLAWVVTGDGVRYVETDISDAELESRVREFMQSASRAGGDQSRLNDLSTELYSLLLQPVRQFLDKNKTVAIVPDKILCYLPFEALRSGEGKYAVQDYRISYAPSATLFVLLSQNAAQRYSAGGEESFLGIGNPAFDREKNPGLLDLPAAEREIAASAAFYRPRRKFIGSDAVKKNIMASLPSADVFHFAGHFSTNELSPQFSKFLLAGNSSTGENNLTASEIGALKLKRTRLVVLSACKTAIETYYHGEGAIGIARTFFAAGVPTVVATRWEVDSAASAALMTAFHRNRTEKGLSAPAALRAAQLELLDSENFGSPFYWAAFAAVGGLEKA